MHLLATSHQVATDGGHDLLCLVYPSEYLWLISHPFFRLYSNPLTGMCRMVLAGVRWGDLSLSCLGVCSCFRLLSIFSCSRSLPRRGVRAQKFSWALEPSGLGLMLAPNALVITMQRSLIGHGQDFF